MKKLFTLLIVIIAGLLLCDSPVFAPPPSFPPLQVEEVDGSPSGVAYKIKFSNDSVTSVAGGVAVVATGSAAGQPITFDIGDDGGDDSTDLGEIATYSTNCGTIFSLPSTDKMLIDCREDWPNATTATTAGAGDDATLFFSSGTIEAARLPVCSGSTAGIMPTTSGVTDGWVMTVQADESVAWEVTAAGVTTFDALTDTTLSSLAAGDIAIYDGSDSWDNKAMSGDATIASTGAITIAANAIEESMLKEVDGTPADEDILSYETTTGDFQWHSMVEMLENVSATQGTILYRGAAAWSALSPGTSGKYLKTQGAAADPMWDTPSGAGDVSAVGNCGGGPCFTDGNAGDQYLVFEVTDNEFETTFTATDPTADQTVTIPDETGTIVLGPATMETDNVLIKMHAETQDHLTQLTGIVVDDSNNMSSIGAIGSGAITSSAAVTAGTSFVIGSADVNETELEVIDGATLNTDDLNVIDGVADSGTLTAAELLHVDGVTSAIQTQLDARCLESVFGEAIESDDFTLATTTLSLVAEIPHLDAAENISGVWEVQDNTLLNFGNDADWGIRYDTTGTELDIVSNNSGADMTINIENLDGTYEADLDVEGDLTVGGMISSAGSGDSCLALASNASYTPTSGYQFYVDNGVWKYFDGSIHSVMHEGVSPTWTGTTHSFVGVANFLVPSGVDADSEFGINPTTEEVIFGVKDSTGTYFMTFDFDEEALDDGDLLIWNASTHKWEPGAGGGSADTSWDDLQDPDANASQTLTFDGTDEKTTWTFSGIYSGASDIVKLIQTGSGIGAGSTLLTLQAADSDCQALEAGDGTNIWKISYNGTMNNDGSATLNLDAANDLTIAGGQIAFDDLAAASSGGVGFGSATPSTAGGFGYTSGFRFYGGNSEDFRINVGSAADTTTFASGTGVSKVNMGAMQLITTGTILGAIQPLTESDDGAYTLTTANAYGSIVVNEYAGTCTVTLPSAAAGMSMCLKNKHGVAQILRIDPEASDYIVMSTGAATSAAGDYYGSTASAAAMVCVWAYDATYWHVTSERGTWAEE